MSRTVNRITLVCYDITSNKLRRMIDKCMKSFGIRIQFSVFLCRLDADGVSRCRTALLKILERFDNEKQPSDSLVIFEKLHSDSANWLLGTKIASTVPAFAIY